MNNQIVMATGNNHKTLEIQSYLGGAWVVKSLKDFGFHSGWEETGLTFEENALIKAQFVAKQTDLAILADDSGLEVLALSGKPGVYSARFAGENATDEDNMAKMIADLSALGLRESPAQFRCVLVFLDESRRIHTFSGCCEGKIICQKRGADGFGYDPMFIPAGFNVTFAEMSQDEKNKISHRANALKQFSEFLKKRD